MNTDSIPAIERQGYTLREASFLYLVAVHSGYFMRRHFARFLDRVDGAMCTHFLRKATTRGHVRRLSFSQNRHVYHLQSKTIYRLCGVEDSQNRRMKGEAGLKHRLMTLDYVLDDLDERFLAAAEKKVEFFTQDMGVPLDVLPWLSFGDAGTNSRFFIDHAPISVQPHERHRWLVRIAYIDDGAKTIKPFCRFLSEYEALLRKLPAFELVYAADADLNFPAATEEFLRRFPPAGASPLFPHGVEHFLSFARARLRWERSDGRVELAELRTLQEGQKVYRTARHDSLYTRLVSGAVTEQELRGVSRATQEFRFETYLLEESYPFGTPRYRGRH